MPTCLTLLALLALQPTGLRLVAIDKDSATLRIELDAPGQVAVRYGEVPMQWTAAATSQGAATEHEVKLAGLAPDREVFYQLEVDGQPAGDVLTFRSGRSWVTRRATLLLTADAADGAAGEQPHADRMFAEVADALVILGEGAGSDATARLHRRSLTDRLVLAASDGPDARQVADVALAQAGMLDAAAGLEWAEAALRAQESACWRVVASSAPLPRERALASTADVVVMRGDAPSMEQSSGKLLVTLADPDAGGAGGRHHLRLAAKDGVLVATLLTSSGAELEQARLERACPIPASVAARRESDAHELEPGESDSSDVDGAVEDCETSRPRP